MVAGCGANLSKILIILFNFLAFIGGLAVLISCVVAYTSSAGKDGIIEILKKVHLEDDIGPVNSVLIAGMVVGGFIICLSFLGCCGGLMESRCLLGTHCAIMIILLIIQVALAIAMFAFKGKFKEALDKSFKDLGEKAEAGKDGACDAFQILANIKPVGCCGEEGKQYPKCGTRLTCPPSTEGKKCSDQLWNLGMSNSKTFGIVALVVVIIEIAAVVFSCCLIRGIKKSGYEYA